MKNKEIKIIIIMIIVSFFLIIINLSIGAIGIPLSEVFNILWFNIKGEQDKLNDINNEIIWNIRFPRVLLAFLVGGAISVSGAVIQSILKNPLASPYTIGISSGASFGISIIIFFGVQTSFLGYYLMPVIGFLSSIVVIFIVLKFSARIDKNLSGPIIIITGMVISLFFNGAQTFLISFNREFVEELSLWQIGSFNSRSWDYVYILIPFLIISYIWVTFYIFKLDILTLGNEQANSIGVNTGWSNKILLIISGILAGASVAVCGTIGFVDLITPHISRKLVGAKHIYVLPMCFVLGGIIMMMSDLLARTIASPKEIPVGAITALIGAPFFGYIFLKGGKK